MTEVKILKRFAYSPDGIRVLFWREGSTQTVDDTALDILISEGACEIIQNKAHVAAPENKTQPKRRGRPRKSQS